MNDLGWDVYSFDHEDGIGQVEIDFAYADVPHHVGPVRVPAHDGERHCPQARRLCQLHAETVRRAHRLGRTFQHVAGGQGVRREPVQVFRRPARVRSVEAGYQFLAGILRHLPAIMAVVAPQVNSYKRLVKQGSMSGFTWAPVFACYGNNNRTNAMRIPKGGGRVELRAADSACNPYLGAALCLAAGLEGVAEDLDPGEPNTENMYLVSDEERARRGIEMLPRTLDEAVRYFAADPLAHAVFGPDMYKAWIEYKEQEWLSYLNHVSDWERERYLRFF